MLDFGNPQTSATILENERAAELGGSSESVSESVARQVRGVLRGRYSDQANEDAAVAMVVRSGAVGIDGREGKNGRAVVNLPGSHLAELSYETIARFLPGSLAPSVATSHLGPDSTPFQTRLEPTDTDESVWNKGLTNQQFFNEHKPEVELARSRMERRAATPASAPKAPTFSSQAEYNKWVDDRERRKRL